MRIGINLLYLLPGVVGGTETVATGLLNGLQAINASSDFILFVNQESAEWASTKFPTYETVVCPIFGCNRPKRYYYEQVKFPKLVQDYRIDLLHSLGYVSPLLVSCPTVVTVLDMNFKAFGKLMTWQRRLALNFFVGKAVRRSERIVTISEFSKQEIVKHYGVSPDKIVVTHLAAKANGESCDEMEKAVNVPAIETPYCVAFSSPSPNKNIPRLIQAYQLLRREGRINQQLVLVGHKFSEVGFHESSTNDMTGVLQTGYLSSADLAGVLKGADFLAFPSFYEGFGLPVIEAMEAGVPVVCSNAGSLPEVAGNAALFFDPFSVDDIAAQLQHISSSITLRNELKRKGYENVKRFSWEKTAKQTLEVYQSVLSQQSI